MRHLKYKCHEVATQTEPVEFAEVQYGYSTNSDEDQEMNMEGFRVETGTDAPKFIILNVVPGRADGTDPWDWREQEPKTKIKRVVNEMKHENERKGVSNTQTDMAEVIKKFALMKGGSLPDDIM